MLFIFLPQISSALESWCCVINDWKKRVFIMTSHIGMYAVLSPVLRLLVSHDKVKTTPLSILVTLRYVLGDWYCFTRLMLLSFLLLAHIQYNIFKSWWSVDGECVWPWIGPFWLKHVSFVTISAWKKIVYEPTIKTFKILRNSNLENFV